MSICDQCTIPTSLATIADARQNLGEVSRFYFVRRFTAGAKNAITVGTDDPTEVATWNALYALTTSAKVVPSPIVAAGFTIPASEPATFEKAGGILGIVRQNPVLGEGAFDLLSQDSIEDIKALECEPSATDGLAVYIVNTCGQIIGLTTDAFTTFEPIPVKYLSVSSVSFGAGTDPNKNMFRIQLDGNWSKGLKVVTPADFDANAWKLA